MEVLSIPIVRKVWTTRTSTDRVTCKFWEWWVWWRDKSSTSLTNLTLWRFTLNIKICPLDLPVTAYELCCWWNSLHFEVDGKWMKYKTSGIRCKWILQGQVRTELKLLMVFHLPKIVPRSSFISMASTSNSMLALVASMNSLARTSTFPFIPDNKLIFSRHKVPQRSSNDIRQRRFGISRKLKTAIRPFRQKLRAILNILRHACSRLARVE